MVTAGENVGKQGDGGLKEWSGPHGWICGLDGSLHFLSSGIWPPKDPHMRAGFAIGILILQARTPSYRTSLDIIAWANAHWAHQGLTASCLFCTLALSSGIFSWLQDACQKLPMSLRASCKEWRGRKMFHQIHRAITKGEKPSIDRHEATILNPLVPPFHNKSSRTHILS